MPAVLEKYEYGHRLNKLFGDCPDVSTPITAYIHTSVLHGQFSISYSGTSLEVVMVFLVSLLLLHGSSVVGGCSVTVRSLN